MLYVKIISSTYCVQTVQLRCACPVLYLRSDRIAHKNRQFQFNVHEATRKVVDEEKKIALQKMKVLRKLLMERNDQLAILQSQNDQLDLALKERHYPDKVRIY